MHSFAGSLPSRGTVMRVARLVLALMLLDSFSRVSAFDASSKTNVAAYWGQSASSAAKGGKEQNSIDFYCEDDSVDVFPVAFMTSFSDGPGQGGYPQINLAGTCDGTPFEGTKLLNCTGLAPAIKKCQEKGKIVTLSLGGAETGNIKFQSDNEAEEFAETVWNLFFGGSQSNSTRPFGSAILNGIDLDIEAPSTAHYDKMVKKLQGYFATDKSRKYYITGAPQCQFPDANMGDLLNAVGFDAIYIQFYNNPECGTATGDQPWNFKQWDDWATSKSLNKYVKVYAGFPGDSTSAGNGYVEAKDLQGIFSKLASFTSFGGAMVWDVSSAYPNSRFDSALKNALLAAAGGSTNSTDGPTSSTPSDCPATPMPSPSGNFTSSGPSSVKPSSISHSTSSLPSSATTGFHSSSSPSAGGTLTANSSALASPTMGASTSDSPSSEISSTTPAAHSPSSAASATDGEPASVTVIYSLRPDPIVTSDTGSSTGSSTASSSSLPSSPTGASVSEASSSPLTTSAPSSQTLSPPLPTSTSGGDDGQDATLSPSAHSDIQISTSEPTSSTPTTLMGGSTTYLNSPPLTFTPSPSSVMSPPLSSSYPLLSSSPSGSSESTSPLESPSSSPSVSTTVPSTFGTTGSSSLLSTTTSSASVVDLTTSSTSDTSIFEPSPTGKPAPMFAARKVHPGNSTDQCLGVLGLNNTNGAFLGVGPCNGPATRSWYYSDNGPTTVEVSGTSYCMDVLPSEKPGEGQAEQVLLYACTNSTDYWQTWFTQGKEIRLQNNQNLDFCLQVGADGTLVQAALCSNSMSQSWVASAA